MTTKIASIPLDNPFHMTVQMESSVGYQYRGVKAGTEVDQVVVLGAGDTAATVISGVIQNDVNENEYVKMVYNGITKVKSYQDSIARDDLLECVYNNDAAITNEDLKLNGTFKKLTIATEITSGGMIAAIALEAADQYEIFKAFLIRSIQIYANS